jgi:hypothetical protein
VWNFIIRKQLTKQQHFRDCIANIDNYYASRPANGDRDRILAMRYDFHRAYSVLYPFFDAEELIKSKGLPHGLIRGILSGLHRLTELRGEIAMKKSYLALIQATDNQLEFERAVEQTMREERHDAVRHFHGFFHPNTTIQISLAGAIPQLSIRYNFKPQDVAGRTPTREELTLKRMAWPVLAISASAQRPTISTLAPVHSKQASGEPDLLYADLDDFKRIIPILALSGTHVPTLRLQQLKELIPWLAVVHEKAQVDSPIELVWKYLQSPVDPSGLSESAQFRIHDMLRDLENAQTLLSLTCTLLEVRASVDSLSELNLVHFVS